jgi:hypothetical protein
MKVTTVRFGDDLWALLEFEAARAGVSVSQYIREAALARAAFAAGTRAGVAGDVLAQWAGATVRGDVDPAVRRAGAERLVAALAREASRDQVEKAEALMRESREHVEGAAALVAQARQSARQAETRLRRRTP